MNLKQQRFALIILLIISITAHLVYGIEEADQMDALESKVIILELSQNYFERRNEELEVENDILSRQLRQSELDKQYAGEFTVTHYCPCEICCGKSDGITSTGTQATEGRTVAVDPEVIPLGSTVIIDGHEYIAEDVGGAIKNHKLDIFVSDHQKALELGVVKKDVYLIE